MNNFEYIKNMDLDAFAEWIDKYGVVDNAPWILWFDKKYCQNCPSETIYVEALNKESKCGWCELHNKCKYFEELEDTPSMKEIIKMWLIEEADTSTYMENIR